MKNRNSRIHMATHAAPDSALTFIIIIMMVQQTSRRKKGQVSQQRSLRARALTEQEHRLIIIIQDVKNGYFNGIIILIFTVGRVPSVGPRSSVLGRRRVHAHLIMVAAMADAFRCSFTVDLQSH